MIKPTHSYGWAFAWVTCIGSAGPASSFTSDVPIPALQPAAARPNDSVVVRSRVGSVPVSRLAVAGLAASLLAGCATAPTPAAQVPLKAPNSGGSHPPLAKDDS